MNTQNKLISIRSKKLGLLLMDARLSAHKSLEECAQAIGISAETLQSYENGKSAPSLPEVEALAFYLDIPLEHFWGSESRSEMAANRALQQTARLNQIRQRMIGTTLRLMRSRQNIPLKDLAEQTSIPETQLRKYEAGEAAIPVPELEMITNAMEIRLEDLFDQHGPIGSWRNQQLAAQKFLDLPPEMQSFICKPVNQPYLNLAMRLSDLSAEKLRLVAESLLEITY